jgi:alkylation response protein AidB-like acyl-CoA dehydrogenase
MVSFELTKEQVSLVEEARQLAGEILPLAGEIDQRNEIPEKLVRRMYSEPYRYSSIYIPEEYGGRELDKISIYLITEEIAYTSPACATLLEVPGVVSLLLLNGTEEQKSFYLPEIASGRFFSFALSEPGAGTDAKEISTKAEKNGRGYILNGRKHLISFAELADFFIVFAKTDPAKGAKGISAFLVEKNREGFSLGKENECIGMRGHRTWELVFKNCRIPEENLIGEEGRGFIYAMRTLGITRATICGIFLGIARSAFDYARRYAKERKTFGKLISDHQAIGFPLAEIKRDMEAARLLALKACWIADRGKVPTMESAMAKSLASDVMLRSVSLAMHVFGGIGATKQYPVERLYRDALTFVWAQGSPEVQKLLIGRGIF